VEHVGKTVIVLVTVTAGALAALRINAWMERRRRAAMAATEAAQ